VRPSVKSTDKALFVTATFRALALCISFIEVFIPTFQQPFFVYLYKILNPVDFISTEAADFLQPYRIEPEFGFVFVPLNVNMRRFMTIACVEKESVWPASECSRH
jgi:hypothetical protein